MFTSDTWVNACGKLPSRRPDAGSYSSAAGRRRCASPSRRSNSARASSARPSSTRLSASQNEQGRNTPSPGGRPSTPSSDSVARARSRRSSARAGSRRRCRRRAGRSAGRKPTSGIIERAGVEALRAVVLGEGVALGVEALARTPRRGSRRSSVRHRSTGPSSPNSSTPFTARSNATHAITLEWAKSCAAAAHLPDALVGILPAASRGSRGSPAAPPTRWGPPRCPCAGSGACASSTSP